MSRYAVNRGHQAAPADLEALPANSELGDGGPIASVSGMQRDLHELAEARSLALHAEVATRLAADQSLITRARERLDHWRRDRLIHPEYARAWQSLLDGSIEALVAAMTEPGESGRALRHTTPFTFVVTPSQRWKLWRRAREQWEGGR